MFLMSGIQAPPMKYPLVFGYDTLVVDFFLGIIRCLKPLLLSQIPFCSTLIGFGSVSHLIPFILVHLERCVCLRLLTYLSFLFVCPCPYVLCVCVCVFVC